MEEDLLNKDCWLVTNLKSQGTAWIWGVITVCEQDSRGRGGGGRGGVLELASSAGHTDPVVVQLTVL